ncbi:hypothetical protein WBG78_10670 [Chryseolinea sp. T2]|uniref:hypothetical protein n=1 Tax=Chryseolinea sp. T2 TaxID=3129255 RepID=UPI0030789EDD
MEYFDDPWKLFQLLAGIVGFCAYIPLTIAILRGTARQSFAAFFLWGLLDAIAMISAILQNGNYWLAASNVAGAFFIAALLLYKKQFEWSPTETLTCLLVIVCLIIWYTSGNTGAIVASSVAVVMAGIPQMAHTMRQPQHTPVRVYLIWISANTISLFSARAWSIDEAFYAICGIVLCAVILGIALLKSAQNK